jgi:endonuclease I
MGETAQIQVICMMISGIRKIIFILAVLFSLDAEAQGYKFSFDSIIFSQPVYTSIPQGDSISFSLTNSGCGYLNISYARAMSPEFRLDDSSGLILAPGSSRTFKLRFIPRQNIEYSSLIVFHTDIGDLTLPIKGSGRFKEAYYDNTFNKFEEDLKASLKSITGAGYVSLGYNATARDHMFLDIDNKKVNGQGATQNTCECVYTGVLAVGYQTRQEMQTNYNFNTEHTFPQSKFSQNEPMRSDLHHLFPTNVTANSQRGDKPFGYVSNPSWTAGGSKTNSTTFEPRDFQKGRTARALMYFVVRYQDYTGFFAPQESLMRQWSAQFPVDSIELRRNADIFAWQKNRNPFIDHPEFLERITTLASNSTAPVISRSWCDTTLIIRKYFTRDTLDYTIALYNSGNTTLNVTTVQFAHGLFNITIPQNNIARQSVLKVTVNKLLGTAGILRDTLLIYNSSADHPLIKIPFQVEVADLRIIASPRNLCDNDPVVLTANSKGMVNWSSGETGSSITSFTVGKYWAILTDSNGCHHTDTVTISRFSKPSVSLVKNSNDTLSVTASAPVKWYHDGNYIGSGLKYYATVSGKYWAIATDTVTGCSTVSDTIIYYKTGIQSQRPAHGILVKPNPASGKIVFPASEGTIYKILNALGQECILLQPVQSGMMELNISSLTPGIYFLQSSEGEISKLIIE